MSKNRLMLDIVNLQDILLNINDILVNFVVTNGEPSVLKICYKQYILERVIIQNLGAWSMLWNS